MKTPTVNSIFADPAASFWLKHALQYALRRDCLDAFRDAELLATLLRERVDGPLADPVDLSSIARARADYADLDINIDDDAKVTHCDDGASWVQAWVRVTPEGSVL